MRHSGETLMNYLKTPKHLTPTLITAAMMILSPQVIADPAISFRQFTQEVESHRARVLENAVIVFNQFKSDFPILSGLPIEISQMLINSYMELHDAPKTMTQSQLTILGYKDKKTILEKLYEVYGVNLEKRPEFINELNSIEDKIKNDMLREKFHFLNSDLLEEALGELKFIERVADVTDTLHTRGPELGFVYVLNSAEKYFLDRKETLSAHIAYWLSENHYKIINGSCIKLF